MGIDADKVYGDEPLPGEVQAAVALEMEAVDVPPDSEEMTTLNKYIRVSLRLAEEEERIKAQAAAMLKSIENRRNGLDYVYGALVRSVTERLLKGGKARSYKTLFGTIGFRKAPAQVFIKEEDTTMEWLKRLHPNWIRTKTEPMRSEITGHFKATGEVPPGCEAVPERDKFYVKGARSEARADGDADQAE